VEKRTEELRAAQQRLVQSGQLAAVAELGAGLAHELNNPMAAILGLTQVLKSKKHAPANARLLEQVEEQAIRCREVVEAMGRLSSAEVQHGEVMNVDLKAMFMDIAQLLIAPFRHRGIELIAVEPPEPVEMRTDPVLIRRVLVQLLHTFRAGMGDGSTLKLEMQRTKEGVNVVLVPDQEIAMGSLKDDWMAAGMGFWVARKLLVQMGGELNAPKEGEFVWSVHLREWE